MRASGGRGVGAGLSDHKYEFVEQLLREGLPPPPGAVRGQGRLAEAYSRADGGDA